MTDLSPAAQAVLNAFAHKARPEPHHQSEAIAAALRVVADQVVPETRAVDSDLDYGAWEQQQRMRAEILKRVDELNNQP
jgi:hypothetical protein